MSIIKNSKGKWDFKNIPKSFNPIYKEALIKYFNTFGPLFEKAKSKSEFEYIITLLRFRGLQDPGWDAWKNTLEAIDGITKLLKRIKDFRIRKHLSLWLYCHIVEASEPYEIIANLINIVDGGRFIKNNFPDNARGIPKSPSQKINKLTVMSNNINIPDLIFPFNDVFNREIRNAISHSDYAIYNGEVRLPKGGGKVYSQEEIQSLVNKALAYFDTFKNLISFYIRSYEKPKIISVHPEFSKDPQEKAITIIRKGCGLVGIKDNFTKEELKKGKIPFNLGRFHRYELNLLKKDPFPAILPKDKIKRINNILKYLPKFISKYIVKKLQNKF